MPYRSRLTRRWNRERPVATKTQLSNNNYLVVILLVTLLVLGGAGLAVKVLGENAWRGMKILNAKNKAVKQLDTNVANAPQLVQSYQNLGRNSGLISNALPTTSDFPGLIALLENMSGVAGVTLKSVSPSVASAASTVGTGAAAAGTATTTATSGSGPANAAAQQYSFTIAVDGSYDAIGKLMAGVETSARPMRVTSLQLSGTGKTLSAQIDLTTFYLDKAGLPFTTETVK